MDFARCVVVEKIRKMSEPKLAYIDQELNVSKGFNLLNNCSNYVTLVQLQDLFGSYHHCIALVGKWIFDSNCNHALPLNSSSLNYCCMDNEVSKEMGGFQKVI